MCYSFSLTSWGLFQKAGLVKTELIHYDLRESFQKAGSVQLWVSYPGNTLRETNLLAVRLVPNNPKFRLLLKPADCWERMIGPD